MDSPLRPVGELPTDVYWRRRIIVLAFAILAIVVLYYLIKGAFTGDEDEASPSPSVSASPSASPDVSITGVAACGVGDLVVDLSRTTRDFPDPLFPSFQVSVTHTGLEDCILDPHEVDTELLITSGSDRIWSNLDCAQGVLGGTSVLLSPDETTTLEAEWPRVRSNTSCDTGLPEPLPGTYHAVLTIHGVESDDEVFTLSD